MNTSPVPRVKALECPNCGGTVELRGHAHTLNAVCVQCLSIIDTKSPSLQILQRFSEAQRHMPLIPLGTRGKFGNAEYEAIGFQIREIYIEGVTYAWAEYLLYNPYRGYLYLTEYTGHWNVIRTIRALPTQSGPRKVVYGGTTYRHFQNAQARTVYVMGEFPWQVRVGDRVTVDDYVAPPHVISAERTAGEVVWSLGTYTAGTDVWRAFNLTGRAPAPRGVYANQPSPHKGGIGSVWRTFALLAVLFLVAVATVGLVNRESEVFRQRYYFDSGVAGEHSFVTPIFDIGGRTGPVTVTVNTNLDNDWAFFAVALINEQTGVAYDAGKEVSYYYGQDSDGRWSEGGQQGKILFQQVPPGRYYLRIEPDTDEDRRHVVNYEITAARGGLNWYWLLLAFIFLPVPAVWSSIRHYNFESSRWSESDYGSAGALGSSIR